MDIGDRLKSIKIFCTCFYFYFYFNFQPFSAKPNWCMDMRPHQCNFFLMEKISQHKPVIYEDAVQLVDDSSGLWPNKMKVTIDSALRRPGLLEGPGKSAVFQRDSTMGIAQAQIVQRQGQGDYTGSTCYHSSTFNYGYLAYLSCTGPYLEVQ